MRRLAVLFLTASACASDGRRPASEPAYRSMKSISAATAVGVNKLKYDELIQMATTELLILKDISAGTVDTAIVNAYSGALESYNDAKTLWDAKVQDTRYSFLPAGRIFQSDSALAKRYKLEISAHPWSSSPGHYYTIPEESIQVIWKVAESQAAEGDSLAIAALRRVVR